MVAAVGRYAPIAMVSVCLLAYAVGYVIRFNIRFAEANIEDNQAKSLTKLFEKISDIALIPAYIVLVTLYLKILASFALAPFQLDTNFYENIVTTAILVAILFISIFKGLDTLEFLEKYALIINLLL